MKDIWKICIYFTTESVPPGIPCSLHTPFLMQLLVTFCNLYTCIICVYKSTNYFLLSICNDQQPAFDLSRSHDGKSRIAFIK